MSTRQIVLDTETTGLKVDDGHRIIEIGCIELINRKFTGNNLHFYFNPSRAVDPGAFAVHGISDYFLRDKPSFASLADHILSYLDGAELIIHNAPFDVGFLNAEFSNAIKKWSNLDQRCQISDTLTLARDRHPGQKNNLDALCKRYGVDTSKREWHGALLDANLLAQVYLAMTGGQSSLFDDETTQATNYAVTEKASISLDSLPKTRVIYPTHQEQREHESYLTFLRTQGACVWDE